MGKEYYFNYESESAIMGQWGLETSAGDSVHDYLQHIQVDTDKFTQRDVKPLLDYTWKDIQVTDFDKLGVVMHLLTHELIVPLDILEEVLVIAKKELLHKNLKHWGGSKGSKGRKDMVVVEIKDIQHALDNKGKGRARHAEGLFEKIHNMIDTELEEIENLTNPMSEQDDKQVEDTLNAEEKTIELPCYGIVVTLTDIELHALTPNRYGGASITSDMHETCPYCNDPACDMNCPDFQEHCSDRDLVEQQRKLNERYEYLCHEAAIHAIEAMIMGHAGAGIDITTPAYMEGIETVHQALTNADFSVEVDA